MVRRVVGVGLVEALDGGTRAALVHLSKQLAQQIQGEFDASERLKLTRAFLVVLRDLEAFDRAKAREDRLQARQMAGQMQGHTPSVGIVDELRTKRENKLRKLKARNA